MITLYGLRTCDTCRRARRWLEAGAARFHFHDLRDDGLSREQLERWVKEEGWEALLNRRSTTWRRLPDHQRENLDEQAALGLMLENPALVKRPVLELGDTLVVGFSEDRYRKLLR